jgi:hypothetical protein
VQTNEYPQRDIPFSEDLGRKARTLKISAFVAGDDVFERRDRLIKACEEPGPGTLVHPTLGTLTVNCTGVSLSESREAGGSARLELSFVEAGDDGGAPYPFVEGPLKTQSLADAALSAIGADFSALYAVGGWADFVADAAADLMRGATVEMRRVARIVTGDSFEEALRRIHRDAAILIQDSQSVVSAIAELAAGVGGDAGAEEEGTRGLLRLTGSAQPCRPWPGPRRRGVSRP